MNRLRAHVGPSIALAIWAHVALLPPGAWALCFGTMGHVALEPAAIECWAIVGAAESADPARAASSCDACVDVPVGGLAIHRPGPRLDAPLAQPILAHLPGGQAAMLLLGTPPGCGGKGASAPAPARLTILRC